MFACVVKEESKNVSALESKFDQESHGSKNLQNDGLPTTVRCNQTDVSITTVIFVTNDKDLIQMYWTFFHGSVFTTRGFLRPLVRTLFVSRQSE